MPPEYFFESNPLKLIDKGTGIFLFIDFDGTLVPIQADPGKCALSSDVANALNAVASSSRTRVAVLSGRSLPDIKERVPIEGIYYGGNHGLDISGPGISFIHPDAIPARDLIDKVRCSLAKKIRGVGGTLIENKGLTFTLHYRLAQKSDALFVRNALHQSISAFGEKGRLTVLRGKKVLELAPNTEWDKGKAALHILAALKAVCLPVYVGDDLTDETAFRALGPKGITIRVGSSRKTAAKYYLKGQWEIVRLLRELVPGPVACYTEERCGGPSGRRGA